MSVATWRLLIVVLIIGGLWGVVLPYAAETETVRARSRWLEEKQIDPAAMYYTDLPLMERILRKEPIVRSRSPS